MFHEVLKFGNLAINLSIRFLMTALVWSYMSEWDSHTECITTNNSNHKCTEIRSKIYLYTSHYHKAGKETSETRETLQAWFVLQYFVILLNVFIDAAHVLRKAFNDDETGELWDMIHYTLYIVYDINAILIPYLLAVWMNEAHRKYYRKMTEEYQLIAIILDRDLTDEQKDYISEAIMKKIELNTDFDFCPQILDISIPIKSPGYTVTILIAVFALITNAIY